MADAAYCYVQVIRKTDDTAGVEQKTFPISPAQAELGVLSEEEMDLVVCARAGLEWVSECAGEWYVVAGSSDATGHTLAEALHALREKLEAKA